MRVGYRTKHTILLFVVVVLCVVVILGSILHLFLKRAEPSFIAQTSNYSNTAFTDLVNKCIINIAKTEDFKDFYTLDANGNNSLIIPDTAKINMITSRLLIDIQNALNNDYPAKLYIPLGSLTDYYLLSSFGPQIPVKIIPISIVNCDIEETFDSVGINQVRQCINLKISVNMHYRGFMLDEKEKIETTVPISETIISGQVPQYYGNGYSLPIK